LGGKRFKLAVVVDTLLREPLDSALVAPLPSGRTKRRSIDSDVAAAGDERSQEG
jgi:hypothetical protein